MMCFECDRDWIGLDWIGLDWIMDMDSQYIPCN
jgi:hypothetical protein